MSPVIAQEFIIDVANKTPQDPFFGMGFQQGFTVNGIQGGLINVKRGGTYRFTYKGGNPLSQGCFHPFYLTRSSVGAGIEPIPMSSTNSVLCDGQSIDVTFTSAFPPMFYYGCQVHPYMGGPIVIAD